MTLKNTKIILFAGLIAAMILPFSGMNTVYAEEINYPKGVTKEDISAYSPIEDTISQQIAPEFLNEIKDVQIVGEYKDREKLIKSVSVIMNIINTTENEFLKKYLEQTIENMKPELAKNGMILVSEYDKDPETALRYISDMQEDKDTFQYTGIFQYLASAFVVYGCEDGMLICSSVPIYKNMNSGDTFTTLGIITQASNWRDLEYHHKITNLQTGLAYLGTYHSASILDQDGNFLDGDYLTINLWYESDETHDIRFGKTPFVQNGYKVYEYLYVN